MMTESNENYKTLALQYAINLVRDMDFSKLTEAHRAVAKANVTNRLFNSILYDNDLTGEQIKKIIDESK